MKGPREVSKEKKGKGKKLPPGGGAAARARQFQTGRGYTKGSDQEDTGARPAACGENEDKPAKNRD